MSELLPAVGIHPTATDVSMPLLELAEEAVNRDFRSLYLPEHTHVPVGSEALPTGTTQDKRYRRSLDPFIGAAFIAATTPLEVGTGVALVGQHDPIALAKAIATLDYLAQGRVVIGVGYGMNRQEAVDHGLPEEAGARATVVEETVRLMRALWTEDEAEFEGTYRSLPRSWAWPKPATPGGPPILLGARARLKTFERVAAWADGWLPIGTNVGEPAFVENLRLLRALWRDAGRVGSPEICYFFHPGTVDEMARQIESGAKLGVQRIQVFLGDDSRDAVLPIMDRLAQAVRLSNAC